MPRQASQPRNTQSRTTSSRTNSRPASGNGRRNASKAVYWPIEFATASLSLELEGTNGSHFGMTVCATCAALLPGSDSAMALHGQWHETINGIDQRAGR